jgi:hypothetical protein
MASGDPLDAFLLALASHGPNDPASSGIVDENLQASVNSDDKEENGDISGMLEVAIDPNILDSVGPSLIANPTADGLAVRPIVALYRQLKQRKNLSP